MSGAAFGLSGLDFIADKIDNLPNHVFNGHFFKGNIDKAKEKARRNSEAAKKRAGSQDQGSDENSGDSNNDEYKSRRNRPRSQSASQPNRHRSRNQPRRPSDKSDDYYAQGYEPNSAAYSEGDPAFGRRGSAAQPRAPSPPQPRGFAYDGSSDNIPRSHQDIDRYQRARRNSSAVMQQQEPYFPPPPGAGNNYHPYNPSDYQPQGYNYPSGNNNAYAVGVSSHLYAYSSQSGMSLHHTNETPLQGRNSSDPYARANSAGGTRQYYDGRHDRDNDRRDRDRDRDRDRERRHRKDRSRSRSGSESGSEKGMMDKVKGRFDTSERALTSSAIGKVLLMQT